MLPPSRELTALIETDSGVPQVAPGLPAWLEQIADLGINRQRGMDLPLLPSDATIPPDELGASLAAPAAMLTTVGDRTHVAELLGAIGDALPTEPPAVL